MKKKPKALNSVSKEVIKRIDYSLIIAVIAICVSTLSYHHTKQLSAKKHNIEIEKYLNDAWELIGTNNDDGSVSKFSTVKNLTEAKKKINLASILDPEHPKTIYMHGMLSYALYKNGYIKQLNYAKTQILNALKKEPKNEIFMVSLSNIYIEQSQLDKALTLSEQAKKINPEYMNAYSTIISIHALKKQYRKALEVVKEAESIFPVDEDIMHNHALIYLEQSNYQKAQELLEKAIEIHPNNTDIMHNLCYVYKKTNKELHKKTCR